MEMISIVINNCNYKLHSGSFCVSPHDRVLCVVVAGGIPGPIAFGSVIDHSCMLWQEQCGDQGSCYLYHNSAMSKYSLIAGLTYKVPAPGTGFTDVI